MNGRSVSERKVHSISPCKHYLKCFFKNIRRGNFKEGGVVYLVETGFVSFNYGGI